MSTRIKGQLASSNEDALAAFLQKKAEIDAMLTRLQALSDDHFNYRPDEITWDHVGTLGRRAAEANHRLSFQGGRACRVKLRARRIAA
jgi:hypothetical protein